MKRLAACTALTFAAVVLAGCGSDDDPEQGSDGSSPSADEETMADGHMDDDDHDESSDVAEGARRIDVTASSFEFDPDEIRVEAGEDLAIALSSEDILHDFTIDELDAHVAADRGETKEGGFTAEEPGTYTYYCAVEGHREAGMEGTLVVE